MIYSFDIYLLKFYKMMTFDYPFLLYGNKSDAIIYIPILLFLSYFYLIFHIKIVVYYCFRLLIFYIIRCDIYRYIFFWYLFIEIS